MKTTRRSAAVLAAVLARLSATLSTNTLPVELRQAEGRSGPLIWDCSYKDKDIVVCYSKKSWIGQDWERCNCAWQRDGPLVYEKCEDNIDCEPEMSPGNRCGKPRVGLHCATCKDNIIWAAAASVFYYPAGLVKSLPTGVPLLHPIGTSSGPSRTRTHTTHHRSSSTIQSSSTSASRTTSRTHHRSSSTVQSSSTSASRITSRTHYRSSSKTLGPVPYSTTTQAPTSQPHVVTSASGIASSFPSADYSLGPGPKRYIKPVAREAHALPGDHQRFTLGTPRVATRGQNNPNTCRFIVKGKGWPGLDQSGNGEIPDAPPGTDEAWVRVYFPDDLSLDYIADKLWRGLALGLMDPIDVSNTTNTTTNSTETASVCGNRFLTTSFYDDQALELGTVPEFLRHLLYPGFLPPLPPTTRTTPSPPA